VSGTSSAQPASGMALCTPAGRLRTFRGAEGPGLASADSLYYNPDMRPANRPAIGGEVPIDRIFGTAQALNAVSNTFLSEEPLDIHMHAGVEVGIVLEGRQERHHEGLVYEVGPGGVWLCGMWEPHGWRVVSRGSTDVVVQFQPEFLGDERLCRLPWLRLFAAPPRDRPRVRGRETRARVFALGRELYEEISLKRPGWECLVRLDLLRLLATLSRNWSPPTGVGPRLSPPAHDLRRILPVVEVVSARPGSRLSVLNAAEICGLSRSQFSLVFRRTMGLTYSGFRLRARLAVAAQQLLSTGQPIEAIARETGFVDGSHLHHAFLKH